MRQPKQDRPKCRDCGKPGTKWHPLPHDHMPIAKPVPASELR